VTCHHPTLYVTDTFRQPIAMGGECLFCVRDDLISRLAAAEAEVERLRGLLREGHEGGYFDAPSGFYERVDAFLSAAPAGALQPDQPSAATENPEAMYSPVAREGHAGASARQIDVAAGDQLVAGQPERCCLDYPRCDCNSPPEPDNLPCGHPASLLLMSAETGEALYCELCDDKSGRRDAEQCETELRAEVERLKTALKTVGDDYPGSSCQQWCYEAAGIRAPAEWPTREEAEKRAAELMAIGRATLGENDDWLCFQRPAQPKVTP
jgi:hypothetical protein